MTGRRALPPPLAATLGGLIAAGCGGAAIATAAPDLLRATAPTAGLLARPHPVLAGTPSEVLEIVAANVPPVVGLVLASAAAWGRFGIWRPAGDLLAAVIAIGTSFRIGAALALHGTTLLPYLPHLPFELAALTVAVSTWLASRRRPVRARPALAAVLVLLCVSAVIEVYATPHRETGAPSPGVAERSIFAPPAGARATAPTATHRAGHKPGGIQP